MSTPGQLGGPVVEAGRVSEIYRRHLSTGRVRLASVLGGHVERESSGAWITVDGGRRMLNVGSYGTLITGARHPTVIAEVERQLHTHPVGTRTLLEPVAARAAEMLAAVTPPGLDRIHFACSGTEATEAAIKIARLNGRRHLVSTFGGYHGKTLGALSVTAKAAFQDPHRPLLPGVSHVPFDDVPALVAVLEEHPGDACFVVEPVQGEGGVRIPAPGYLAAVREACTRLGALLVVDEVQTGLGRLGRWWGVDAEGVVPDVLLAGKALGGGVVPVSAAVTTDALFAPLDRDPVLHTSTFSAAPLGMAAVCGALRAIVEDGLVARAALLGEQLLAALTETVARHLGHHRVEVRGVGLLIGVEFADPAMSAELLLALAAEDVLGNVSLSSDHVVRLTPPATMTGSDVDFLLARFDNAVRGLAERNPEHEVLTHA